MLAFSRPGHSGPPAPMKLRPRLVNALKSKRAAIEEICKVSGVAGVSIAVIDQGKTILQDNFGYCDLENREPVTSDTIFPIASMTKSFTGVCINRLRHEGKLSLDDLIVKHIPEAKSQDHVVATITTIADLLRHRTGLQGANNIWLGAQGELLFNRDNILEPLNMTRTIMKNDEVMLEHLSLAYGTLDNRVPYQVPVPGSSASRVMGAAGGLLSTANDLAKYYKALMGSWQTQAKLGEDDAGTRHKPSMFGQVPWLFTPLQIMEMPALREKSYAARWARSQLPTTVGDIGINAGLLEQMPLLAAGINSRLALWHQGSLVGATSFVMMLPETESAVVVLTNTMAINDAADWIGQLLVETLLDAPVRNDYVAMASLSADSALKRYEELAHKVEEGRESKGIGRDLNDYIGSYVGFGGIFRIEVVDSDKGLAILFQGRASQMYQLGHHHEDTFTWFMTWNEQIKNARFIVTDPAFYFISFQTEQGKVAALNWVHDASIPEGEFFMKV
ncbi:beta-lactamase/transpeptidase-like protein [Dactylonectria macrodidyma]|uniref:Beta-lactamase/transpeptidase-like protein n=1 Tax=Dactylonectria macrodidyma TaxID=307937 RepID=A0A9P9DYB8_9HYPO|nr:beta-lactamase/transpeptidase-like protein [Dactylonectria macrodidyma]